jgi:predicted enzyme related to lactoylglutathione lyase
MIVHVDDMERETAFYRDVLGLAPEVVGEWWTTFPTGGSVLALHGGGRIGTGNVRLNFAVADLDAAREELASRGVELSVVREPIPGVRVCDGTDPEGNVFSLEERR